MGVLRTKSIEQSIADTDEPEYQLKKNLTALDLTVFGVGVIIGAGIFTLTGRAAATVSGPAIVLSFVVSAICCGLAALCYAEFASTVPVSGSAYTFSYASLGEMIAWIIGWDLLLELLLGASVVAQGWSTYAVVLMENFGITWPEALGPGGSVDVLAMLLIAVLTILTTIGIKESMRVNLVLVAVKLFVVLFVIIAGIGFINPANYSPFIPPAAPGIGRRGMVSATADPGRIRLGTDRIRYRRHLHRRGAGVLRLHRIRRGGDHRRGGQEPEAGSADRHHRFAGDLHDPVRRGGPGDHRHGQVRPDRPQGRTGPGVHRPRASGLRHADLRWRGGRADDGGTDAHDRRCPGGVRDVPRPPAAAGAEQGAPEVPDPLRDHDRRSASSPCWSPV